MSERPRDGSGESDRTGPLGDWDNERAGDDRTRETPRNDADETRQIPRKSMRKEREDEEPTRFAPNEARQPMREDRRSRRISSSGFEDEGREAYPKAYFEAAEERQKRLREIYGGVDWLASFVGFLLAALTGSLLSLVGGLVLVPLADLQSLGGGIGPAAITALVISGVLIFLTYFCGGYVAGRLARFDGGRNGMMVVAWAIVVTFLSFAVFGFLPGAFSELIRDLTQNQILPALSDIQGAGLIGVIVLISALALALLGGFAGGRSGSRYHTEIDSTT